MLKYLTPGSKINTKPKKKKKYPKQKCTVCGLRFSITQLPNHMKTHRQYQATQNRKATDAIKRRIFFCIFLKLFNLDFG